MFELGPDLLLSNAMQCTATRGKKQTEWKPIFWPDAYAKEGHSMKLDDNRLLETQLSKLAKKISKCRKIQRERALAENS